MTTIEPVQKKKRGCFFYGCITCIVLALLVAIGLGVAGYSAYRFVNKMVVEYTDTSPATLPDTALSADEFKKLNERIAAFNTAINAHTNVPPLMLTGPELNALINDSSALKDVNGKVYLTLDGNKIKGEISLPLDKVQALQMLKANGRYLNGSGIFTASIENGNLSVSISSIEVKGKPLPGNYVAALQSNLSQIFNQPQNRTAFDNYQSIEVKDGTLIVTPKKN
jgi:hypothetical protein